MAKTTKRAKRMPGTSGNPFDDPEYRRRADAEDETWAQRTGLYLHLRELQTAEELARSIGLEGIAERRLDLARDGEKFQAFMAYYVRPSRPL
jgi:hypothetical protein